MWDVDCWSCTPFEGLDLGLSPAWTILLGQPKCCQFDERLDWGHAVTPLNYLLLNGSLVGYFPGKKDFRQKDPLSSSFSAHSCFTDDSLSLSPFLFFLFFHIHGNHHSLSPIFLFFFTTGSLMTEKMTCNSR
jgi:hypothetical protein